MKGRNQRCFGKEHTEEIPTAVVGNIKMVMQMLFDKHDNDILNCFYV